jgi:NADH dehydrogenase
MVNNKPIRSHTVIWTAGIANNPFFAEQDFQLAKNGKARVDQYLQSETGIYVIGDNADTPYSGMAQTALYDGKFVAKNLKRLANNQDAQPYLAKKPIYVFPAGHHWAAVLWGEVRIYGKLGWLLRSFADLIAYHDYEPWQLASKRWMAENDAEESCPLCSTNTAKPSPS